MKHLTITLLLLTIGCGDEADMTGYFTSDDGLLCHYADQGTVVTERMSLQTITDILYQEIQALEDPTLKEAAQGVCFDIIDNHSFLVGDVWACGQWLPQCNTVKVCLYSQAVGYAVPTDPPPPTWTVRTSWRDPSLYVWGVVPTYFPALEHELGHVVYGPTAGH